MQSTDLETILWIYLNFIFLVKKNYNSECCHRANFFVYMEAMVTAPASAAAPEPVQEGLFGCNKPEVERAPCVACSNPCSYAEESPAMSARRRRMEIRRLKMMVNNGNYDDIGNKRSRTRSGSLCAVCLGVEKINNNDNNNYGGDDDDEGESRKGPCTSHSPMEIDGGKDDKLQDLKPYNRRLVRSVSSPAGAKGAGLCCTCTVENCPTGKENRNDVPKINSPLERIAESMGSEEYDNNDVIPTGNQKDGYTHNNNNNNGEKVDSVEQYVVLNRSRNYTKIKTGISRVHSESIGLMARHQCPPHGTMSVIGRRREMEDAVAVVPSFFTQGLLDELHFFGVYDGHGGSQASVFCKDHFHEVIAEEMRERVGGFNRRDLNEWKKIMNSCFMKMDIKVGGYCPNGNICELDVTNVLRCCQDLVAPENVGSTAVVAVMSSTEIVIANCGDSRAVISRGGKAIPLSEDHKPEREDELVRIEAAGGRIIHWNGYRVGGFLAMTRALGDRYLKKYVISEPEVTCIERTAEDECLILGSDGLWDVLSNDLVCEVARKCLAGYRPHRSKGITVDTPVAAAATLLTKLAIGRGSSDNISVIVVDLKTDRRKSRR